MTHYDVFDAFLNNRNLKEGELYTYCASYALGGLAHIRARLGYASIEFASYRQEPQFEAQPRQLGLWICDQRTWFYTETEIEQYPALAEQWRAHNETMRVLKHAMFQFRTICESRGIRYDLMSESTYWAYRHG